MSDDLLDYGQLFGALSGHRVELVLIGGLAVNVHGVIRATADADVVPSPERANLGRLTGALAELEAHVPGADPSFDPLSLDALTGGATVKCETRFGPLHIVQSQPGLPPYSELSARALEIELEGLRIAVCSYEDLVAMKQATGRPQDELDLSDLRRMRGGEG